MANRIRHPDRVHLRRFSRGGYLVIACNGQPVRDNMTVKFANLPSGANCPDCIARAQRELERGQVKSSHKKEVLI